MMNRFTLVAVVYFFYELVVKGLVPTFNGDSEQFDPYSNVFQQVYDLFVILCLLVILRPRVWPEYFSLETIYQRIYDNEFEQRRLAPLLNAVVDEKALHSSKSRSSDQFNSGDPVVIINPLDESGRDEEETSASRAFDYHNISGSANAQTTNRNFFRHLKIGFKAPK